MLRDFSKNRDFANFLWHIFFLNWILKNWKREPCLFKRNFLHSKDQSHSNKKIHFILFAFPNANYKIFIESSSQLSGKASRLESMLFSQLAYVTYFSFDLTLKRHLRFNQLTHELVLFAWFSHCSRIQCVKSSEQKFSSPDHNGNLVQSVIKTQMYTHNFYMRLNRKTH